MANVAHLVRASVCGTEGSGFDAHHSPQEKVLVIQGFFFIYEYCRALEKEAQ